MKQVASPVRRLRKISIRGKERAVGDAKGKDRINNLHDLNEGTNGRYLGSAEELHSNNSNKPLPNATIESTPPSITIDNSPDLQQLQLGSPPSTSNLKTQASSSSMNRTSNVSSNASENWTAPEDEDGAYIRKTYAYFDTSGVKGDGLLDGKEWTREKGAKAAWDQSQSSLRSRGSPENGSVSTPYLSPQLSVNEDMHSVSSPAFTAHDSLAASGSSLGAHGDGGIPGDISDRITNGTSHTGVDVERKDAVKHVDR